MKNVYFSILLMGALMMGLGSCSKKDKTSEPPPTHTTVNMLVFSGWYPGPNLAIKVSFIENGTEKTETATTNSAGLASVKIPVNTQGDISITRGEDIPLYNWKIGPFEEKEVKDTFYLSQNSISIERNKPDQYVSIKKAGVIYQLSDFNDVFYTGPNAQKDIGWWHQSERASENLKFKVSRYYGALNFELYLGHNSYLFNLADTNPGVTYDNEYIYGDIIYNLQPNSGEGHIPPADRTVVIKFRVRKPKL